MTGGGSPAPDTGFAGTDGENTETPRAGDFVQSLDRGLAVIRAFSRDSPELTLSDVARATGLTRAAARRFLLTLERLGYVGSTGRIFSLRPRVLELGYAYLSSFGVAEIAQTHLEELVGVLHESCSASVLDGDAIVYVARAAANRIMTIGLAVGSRLPAHCTSMGRVLLAGLPPEAFERYLRTVRREALTERTVTAHGPLREIVARVREDGYALVDQELEDGVRSIAAPIHGSGGEVLAAVNTSTHATRVSVERLRSEFLPNLLATAGAIDADLRSARR